MAANVVVLGFDAVEATLVERWMDEGLLPTFSELARKGTSFRPANNVDLLPDSIWIELALGRRASSLGWYWRPEQVHAGEARIRENRVEDYDLTAFWNVASRAGRRVAVVDVPYAGPAPDLNGVLLREWGVHIPAFGLGSDPEDFVDRLLARYGPYPFPHSPGPAYGLHVGCDSQNGSRAALESFPAKLAEAIDLKARVLRDLLEQETWDVFVGTFSEGHCAGHQLWHFFDETSPWHEPDAPPHLKRAVRDLYARLDERLADVLEAAGDDATVLVLLSHGMGPHIGGWQLLQETFVRLGYTSAASLVGSVRSRLPQPVRKVGKAVVRGLAHGELRDRLKTAAGTPLHPLEVPGMKAIPVRNGFNGAVRINLRGRDPLGSVDPGAEYERVCADLKEAIEALHDAETGEPVVEAVVRADVAFGADRHPNLPDLVVRFRRDRVVSSVHSERVGTVTEPARSRLMPRSGDHTPHTRLWAYGPAIPAGRTASGGHVLDLAPTVLELLDVPRPENLEGSPLRLRERTPV